MAISRREWLKRTGAATAAASLAGLGAGCGDGGDDALPNRANEHATPPLEAYQYGGALGPEDLFQHGVASGDPLPNAVVIWTRVTPGAAITGPVDVWYEVAIDAAFERRVAAGTLVADPLSDYTVKYDVTGLVPSSTLYYRFMALGRTSPIGRMRTAPEGAIGHLRFAVVSCSSLAHGYFHVYRNIAARADLEAVIHLGDYIYEYGSGEYGGLREYEPATEIFTLADYRMRYAQYRREPELQELHRQHPMIHVWDDHEVANDSWLDGAENHDPATEGGVTFADRKAAAMQAYSEWMPVRAPEPDPLYRRLAYGDLLDLVVLDTRHEGRSAQIASVADDNETRTLLGFEQEAWLNTQLDASAAKWKVLAQQVMIGRVETANGEPIFLFMDSWDGYPLARTRLLQHIVDAGISNVVVLTGDIHSSWANEVAIDPYDPAVYDPATGEGAVAVEFVTPAVSSPGIPFTDTSFITNPNPQIRWVDTWERGCIVLDVQAGSVQADWYHVEDVTDPAASAETFAKAFAVFDGDPKLVEVAAPMPTRPAPPLAP